MRTKCKTFLILIALSSLGWSCSDSDESVAYDPSKPIVFENFSPDSGRIRTRFVIEGSNFGNDPSKVRVRFNNKEALVLNVVNNAIYTIVPKQPGDSSIISVIIGNDSVAFHNKKFVYHITESVSTVVGKAKEKGNKDGSLNDATFDAPRWLAIDYEDNILYTDGNNHTVRLISLNSDEVVSLGTLPVYPQNFAFTPDRKTFYSVLDNGTGIYKFDAAKLWVPERIGEIGFAGYFHCCTMGSDPRYLYTRQNIGVVHRIDLENPYEPAVKFSGDYSEDGGQGNIAYSPVENCFYLISQKKSSIFRLSADGKEYVKYSGGGSEAGVSQGHQDGPKAQALYKTPRGIAINSEGDIFIADEGNHVIRKIDHRTHLVTTVAGQPGKSGYEDGEPAKALFHTPMGLTFDKEDFLYIADQGNHCIRKLAIE